MSRAATYLLCALKFLLPVFVLYACVSKEETGSYDDGSLKDYPVSLAVSSPQPGPDTKVSVSGTSVAWEEDDKIKITAVAADNSYGTADLTWFSDIEGKDKHHASFSGFVTMTSEPQDCYFTYPVKSSTEIDGQTGRITMYYNAQTGLHEPFMYARAAYSKEGISVRLAHVGAMLEVDVQIPEVTQITFVGNALETISPVVVDSETGAISYTNLSNTQITVPVNPDGRTYIAVPPVNMVKGFSIICSNSDASKSMIRTFSSGGGLQDGYDFSQNVGHIIPITLTGTLESYAVTASKPVIEHTKTQSGLLTGTSVTFTMNKAGASDKIIEEWGAKLLDSKGAIVRQVSKTNADPIRGQSVTLDIANNWKLLPAGSYTFAPYYKIYGQTVSLASSEVTISDPGVRLEIHGKTSYNKYLEHLDGKISLDTVNSHDNTTIEGLAVSSNVDASIVDSFVSTLDGVSMGDASITSGSEFRASFGDHKVTKFKSYAFAASIKVGALEFSSSRNFEITGLPYEADFTQSDPRNWTPAWAFTGKVEYNNSRVNYIMSSTEDQLGGVRSPAFHLPQELPVITSFYSCGRNVNFSIVVAIDKEAYLDIYYTACSATEGTVKFGQECIRSEYKVSYSNGNYLDWSSNIRLNPKAPSIMYSARSKLYDKALYKIRIHYSK